MIEAYCPRCEDFTPLTFDQAYEWKGTDRLATNIVCPHCASTLSILRGDALGAHALQKMAELAHYASPALPHNTKPIQRRAKGTRPTNRRAHLKLV
jgi:hypothetical protein